MGYIYEKVPLTNITFYLNSLEIAQALGHLMDSCTSDGHTGGMWMVVYMQLFMWTNLAPKT